MCQYTSLIIAGIIVKKCAYIGQYSVKIEVLYFLILALVPTQNMAYSSGLLLRFFDQQIQTNPVEMKWNVPFLFNTPMFYHPLTVRQYSQVFLVTLDWSIQHYVTQWYPCSHGLDLSKSEKKTAITRLSPRRLRDLQKLVLKPRASTTTWTQWVLKHLSICLSTHLLSSCYYPPSHRRATCLKICIYVVFKNKIWKNCQSL